MLQQLDTAIAFVVVMLMLSLLVTALVQAVSALLDLRGRNLARSLTALFQQIDVSFRGKFEHASAAGTMLGWIEHPFRRITIATRLADSISRHPTLAHTFSRAKAIRKEELLDVLKDLGSAAPAGKIDPVVRQKLQAVLATEIPGGIPTIGTAQALVDQLTTKIPALKKEDATSAVASALGSISSLEAGVEKWFNTVMDRASDVFTRWTRIITIVISVLFVVVLHIDAGLVLHQISTNPGLKAGLTKMSDTALSRADETIKNGDRASAALREVAGLHKDDPIAADLDQASELVSCGEGRSWLNSYKLPNGSKVDSKKLTEEFEEACQKQTLAALGKSGDEIKKMRQDLAATDLRLIPAEADGIVFVKDTDKSITDRVRRWFGAYRDHPRHVLGTLAMVVLLSLGAPFWFNALRQLSNLKPAISNKISKEEHAV